MVALSDGGKNTSAIMSLKNPKRAKSYHSFGKAERRKMNEMCVKRIGTLHYTILAMRGQPIQINVPRTLPMTPAMVCPAAFTIVKCKQQLLVEE